MDLPAPLLIFYVRNDALGDGLLRIPALRAARTAFPRSHIVYGCQGKSSLTGMLHKHAAPLVDDFRMMPLSAILAEFARPGGQKTVVDFRTGVPGLMVTGLQLLGRGVHYEPNFAGHLLSLRWGTRWTLRPEHNAWRYHRLIERLAGRHLPFDHRLEVPQAARDLARRIRGADDRPLILLGGNARGSNKLMTDAQISAIAGNLIDTGYQVLYLVTPGKGPTPQSLAAMESRLTTIGPDLGLDVEAFGDLLLALGEMAAAYVGMEGGLGHLFATVMTPTVIVNHGANMERWRPLSNMVEVVPAPRHGRIANISDTPVEAILEATHRLLATCRRNYPAPAH
jgi:ADP-heptose:LPS heptosyltransferase